MAGAMLPPKAPAKKRRRTSVGSTASITHVVFLVDNSGSMECENRIQMVFDAVQNLLQAILGMDGIVCSLVTFDDTFKVCFERREVDQRLQELVREVCKATRPKGTGRYLEALAGFRSLVSGGMTVGILLSDGEPTEVIWEHRPTACIENAMCAIRQEFGNTCILHTVGFGDFGMSMLQSLARLGGGTFHDCQVVHEQLQSIFGQLGTSVSTLHGSLLGFGEEALTRVPPKDLEPPDAWRGSASELRSRARPCWAWLMIQRGEDDLRACGDARLVYLHHQPFAQGALRYAYHARSAHWYSEDAVPGSRFHLVVKESKFVAKHRAEDVHKFFLQNHRRAQEFAKAFNAAIDKVRESECSKVRFVPAYVLKISDEAQEAGCRYVTAERYISGNYVKLNGNDGFVDSQSGQAAEVAAAFSHFTFQDSGGQELCVDIQGVGTTWTDPQIHSLQKQFGIADLGRRGIDMFFMSHKCGPLCQKLLLSKPGILHGDEDRPRQPCVVCLDGPRRMLCQPCRHLCLCQACAVGLHRCPICRDPTTSIVWVADDQSGVSSTYIRESELDRMRHVDSGQKTEEAVFG
ncbi:ak1 [Symbiodinium necroappetens]|uniref:Ak1 protein n=1 Tax=Symbiodinium necroappetens TaxID=1628268 RepID=A0A812RQ90_9DINO|nr:ak1 [Symbiodinium necroappetens]